MKTLLVILLVLSGHILHAQRWGSEFGANYMYANPMGGMGNIIDRGHGASFNYGFVTPSRHFSFGFDLSLAQYGRDKTKQEYTFDDGTVAPMDIIVSNSFVNFMAYSRWYLATNGLVRPFLVGRIGYSNFHTNLNIYDPDDMDHCEPVDSDVLYKDGTMTGSIGAGVKIDFASVFKKIQKSKFYLEGNFSFTQGGTVRYMNTDADTHQHHTTTPDADPVSATFVNTQTRIYHQHHVGYLYESPVQMTEIRVGFSMNISR